MPEHFINKSALLRYLGMPLRHLPTIMELKIKQGQQCIKWRIREKEGEMPLEKAIDLGVVLL